MSRSPFRLLLTAALLVAAATPVRADVIHWHYSWSANPLAVVADGKARGVVVFTDQTSHPAVNSSDIVATNLHVFSVASATHPDTLVQHGAYALTLTLKDDASGQKGTLTFTGKLSGTFSLDSADISNTFTGPMTQALTLGGNAYTVTIGPYSPPGPTLSPSVGSIAAFVEVNGGGVSVADVPEPSALALCGVGGSLLAFMTLRRRRRWRV